MAGAGPTLLRLKHAFPRQDVPAETLQVYAQDLATIPPPLLDCAVTVLIRTGQWFPAVSEIRNACAELMLELPSETQALAQIDSRMTWAREVGVEGDGSAPAVHPLVTQALRQVGGYPAFRSSEEPAVVRGQFGRFYREIRGAAIRDAQLAPALESGKGRATLSVLPPLTNPGQR